MLKVKDVVKVIESFHWYDEYFELNKIFIIQAQHLNHNFEKWVVKCTEQELKIWINSHYGKGGAVVMSDTDSCIIDCKICLNVSSYPKELTSNIIKLKANDIVRSRKHHNLVIPYLIVEIEPESGVVSAINLIDTYKYIINIEDLYLWIIQ